MAFLSQLGLKADREAAHFTFFAVLLFVCYLIVRLFEKKRWLNESITSLAIVSLHLKLIGLMYKIVMCKMPNYVFIMNLFVLVLYY